MLAQGFARGSAIFEKIAPLPDLYESDPILTVNTGPVLRHPRFCFANLTILSRERNVVVAVHLTASGFSDRNGNTVLMTDIPQVEICIGDF